MPANINEERMFYYGEAPWHGIGTELKSPATAKEAIEAARLDYKVGMNPIMTDFREIDGVVATAREDNHEVLGIVTPKYKIIQNTEAFSFFDSVVGEGKAVYHTAGALGKGERIWILAKLPNDMHINGDTIEKNLVLTTSHDGKSTLKLYFTPIRVVCQNTLSMSLKDAGDGIAIRHSGNIKDKVKEAQRILGLSINAYDLFEDEAQALADRPLTVEEVERYFNVLVFGKNEIDEESTKLVNRKSELLTLFERGIGNDVPGQRHTAWTAYNAVTEYVDHSAPIRNVKKDPSNRIKNIWFGNGAKIKREAYGNILQLVL